MATVTQIAKWGNSLSLRLPRAVALEAQVGEGDTVDVSVSLPSGGEYRARSFESGPAVRGPNRGFFVGVTK